MSLDFVLWQVKDVELGGVIVTSKERLAGTVQEPGGNRNTTGDSGKGLEIILFVGAGGKID